MYIALAYGERQDSLDADKTAAARRAFPWLSEVRGNRAAHNRETLLHPRFRARSAFQAESEVETC